MLVLEIKKMKDRLISGDKLSKSLYTFLSVAVLGLGAACAHAEPVALPTSTPLPTTEPTSIPTNFERNCEEILEATQVVAVASTILGELYSHGITPFEIKTCIPVVVTVNNQGTNCFLTDDLLEKRIPGKLENEDETKLCYGTKLEAVLKQCSTPNP